MRVRRAAGGVAALLGLAALLLPPLSASRVLAQGVAEPADSREVHEFFEKLERAFDSGDAGALAKLLSKRYEDDFEADGGGRMRERLAAASRNGARIEFDVVRAVPRAVGATAVVRTRVADRQPDAESDLALFVLRKEDGALVAARRLTLDEDAERRVAGRTYRAADGSFELGAPAGWAIAPPRRKVGTSFETVTLVDPESEAYALFVAFAIPFEIDSLETMARLDAEKLATLADKGTSPRVLAEGKFAAAGLDGYQQVTEARVGGKDQVFRRVCLQRERTCYQFLFRSTPSDAYARDAVAFDEVLERFRPIADTARPRRGVIDGNLYRHADVGFEIAAPPGWAIEEAQSSYTAQVFFTPGSGQSYAMVCALEIGHPIEPDALATPIEEAEKDKRKTIPAIKRLGAIEDGTVDGNAAKTVVQSYPIEGFERTVKSTYVAAGTTLFVLVLHATPAEFEAIEGEFDALVESFIRTP